MSRPNFVFIMTDTQGANIIGAHGNPAMKTPCIDRLASQGVRFERAYTTCPVCAPARAGMLTGSYPSTAGVWANHLALGRNIKTMGERFKDAGYRTVYTGKYHLDGHDYFGTGACPPEFEPEYWYDGKNYVAELTDEQVKTWRLESYTSKSLRDHGITSEFTWGHRVADRASRFLASSPRDPFLLTVSFDEPHHPWTCPPEYAGAYDGYKYPVGPSWNEDLSTKPALHQRWAGSYPQGRKVKDGYTSHPLYFGCNTYADHLIGRVLDAVDRYEPENTCVIFTSDHGSMLCAHGLCDDKGPVMYEEASHIPLIVRHPGHVQAGSVVRDPVSHIDILPTMLDLAGLPKVPFLDGESLSPTLLHGEKPGRDVIMEWHRHTLDHDGYDGFFPIRCIISGSWKLTINLCDTDELYDLSQDPRELNNRINDPASAAIRNDLHDRMIDMMNKRRDPFRGPAWERRLWHDAKKTAFFDTVRLRVEDGYAPPALGYMTALPGGD